MFKRVGLVFIILSIYVFANSQLLQSEYYDGYMIKESQKYAVYACLADKIYEESNLKGHSTLGKVRTCINTKWQLVSYIHKLNGFEGGIYRNIKNNTYIMAIGGTTANPKGIGAGAIIGDILDVGTDLRLLSNFIPDSQSKSVLAYIKNPVTNYKKRKRVNIDAIVGHSLGGGLAAYAGLYSGIKVFAFNPSPIPITKDTIEPFLNNYAIKIIKRNSNNKITNISFTHSSKITNIMSGNDPISNLSFILENTDRKYYNPNDSLTAWNSFKALLLIPKELHLDYANLGHNIWFSKLMTGHSMDALYENMKNAKEIGDYNAYIMKWDYLTKKVNKLQKVGFQVTYAMDSTYNYNEGIVFDDYYPTKKASQMAVIGDMRILYNKAMGFDIYDSNIDFVNFLGLKGKIDIPKSRLEEMQNVDTEKYNDYISYKEYMLIAEATYKKIFGGQSFFSNIRKKSKSYLVFDKRYANYADASMRSIYGHIFILHFVSGTPRWYLENDSQEVTNSFVINFFSRFYANVLKYKNKIKRN